MIYVNVALKNSTKSLFLYSVPSEFASSLKVGCRVKVPLIRQKRMAIAVEIFPALPSFALPFKDKIKNISEIVDSSPLITEPLMETAKWMASFYLSSLAKCLFCIIPSGIKSDEDEKEKLKAADKTEERESFSLSDEQKKAVKDVMAGGGVQYLYGKTGSGKTAVFFELAKKLVAEGKGVIYLLPEIGLTSQIALSSYAVFGKKMAILHSKMTKKKRLGEWMRVLKGEALFVIGARSAVFSPVKNLSLIIIDEEHESSYKAGNEPRYNARQVAMYRAQKEGGKALFASATPSLECWKLMEDGKIKKHVLTKRLAGGKESEIQIVDMKNYPSATLLSPPLVDEIRSALNEKRSALLLLNRRGFTHTLECSSCSKMIKCANCNVPLTFHKDKKKLICHYCGYFANLPKRCPSCGCLEFISHGYGTEFAEEVCKRTFPNARIKRIDTDTADEDEGAESAFRDFKDGKIDILLGTKMIAKGFNFPRLKVVGVVLSDTMLSLPDFRAYETSFSLITQAAGRAGRFHPDGKVIIQTFMSDNPLIKNLAKGETKNFYKWEMARRKEQGFPPYSRLARLVFRSKSEEKSKKCAETSAKIFREILLEKSNPIYKATEVLGSSPCPIDKIAQNYRYELILRGPSISHINKLISLYLSAFQSKQNVHIEIDIDPVNLM